MIGKSRNWAQLVNHAAVNAAQREAEASALRDDSGRSSFRKRVEELANTGGA